MKVQTAERKVEQPRWAKMWQEFMPGYLLAALDYWFSAASRGPRLLHYPGSVFNGDGFDFSEKFVRVLGSFSTYPRTLHPPKRKVELSDEPAVRPDQAGLQFLSHPVDTAHVAGPHRGRQPVFNTVGSLNHFLFALEGDDTRHWTKYLFLHAARFILNVCYDCGKHKVSCTIPGGETQRVHPLTTQNLGPFRPGSLDVTSDLGGWKPWLATSYDLPWHEAAESSIFLNHLGNMDKAIAKKSKVDCLIA